MFSSVFFHALSKTVFWNSKWKKLRYCLKILYHDCGSWFELWNFKRAVTDFDFDYHKPQLSISTYFAGLNSSFSGSPLPVKKLHFILKSENKKKKNFWGTQFKNACKSNNMYLYLTKKYCNCFFIDIYLFEYSFVEFLFTFRHSFLIHFSSL